MAKRIFIVEDDLDTQVVLVDCLDSFGYIVEPAADGTRAIAACKRSDYAGMTLDIGLPDMSGLDVLKRVRILKPRLPIIVITGNVGCQQEVLREGAQAFLLKPFSRAELRAAVEEFIGPSSHLA